MGGGTEKARPRVVHVLEGGMLAAQARASRTVQALPAETVDPRHPLVVNSLIEQHNFPVQSCAFP